MILSDSLIKFNEQFPNSKYREIRPQYKGPVETEEERKKYQDSKRPMDTLIHSFDDIKNTKNRIGWIVPKEYIVIDIDKKQNAKVVFDILQNLKIKFSYMTGKHGGHFIFKNESNIGSISAGLYSSLGIVVDVRCGGKGYIILPENDDDRKWGEISNNIDNVPYFLIPLKKFKAQNELLGLGEGDGRNDALLKHILGLIDYAKELNLQEKCESIRLINSYMFKKPLTDIELQKTVLRDDILNKQSEDEEDKGCYEEKIATKIIKDKQIITCNDDCYIYNGKYYRAVLDETEIERIIHLEYNNNLKEKQRKEILKFIKLKSWIPYSELNKNWNEIVFKNGVLNLSTGKLVEHSPSVYNTIYIDCNYVQDASYSKQIDDFFNQISSKNEMKKNLLYEIIGCCLLRKNIFSKFFICYGNGQTGKSTYLKLINNLIGDKNTAHLSLNDLSEKYMACELFGKLVNLGDDIPYYLSETADLKKLVTGETYAAERKFKTPINFSNFATLLFTTNELPEVSDRSSGFYRRFMIIEINNVIENPDPFFLDRLTEQDMEYLLSVAIEKLLVAMKNNKLSEDMSDKQRLEEYRVNQNSVLSYVKDYRYTKKDLDHRPCRELYIEYTSYCKETGYKALKKINFDKEICKEFKFTKQCTTWKEENETNQCWRYV